MRQRSVASKFLRCCRDLRIKTKKNNRSIVIGLWNFSLIVTSVYLWMLVCFTVEHNKIFFIVKQWIKCLDVGGLMCSWWLRITCYWRLSVLFRGEKKKKKSFFYIYLIVVVPFVVSLSARNGKFFVCWGGNFLFSLVLVEYKLVFVSSPFHIKIEKWEDNRNDFSFFCLHFSVLSFATPRKKNFCFVAN